MSFKREGDDKNWLKVLQDRRISELLSEDIPTKEAHLMKNGKLACMVCHNRPVFDTLNVLVVHRQGKKHAHHAAIQEEERDLLLQQPSEHSAAVNNLKGPGPSFKCAAPYDPTLKKRKTSTHGRKLVLDLSTTSSSEPSVSSSEQHDNESMSGDTNTSLPQTVGQYVKSKRYDSLSRTKRIIKPYESKRSVNELSGSVQSQNQSFSTIPSSQGSSSVISQGGHATVGTDDSYSSFWLLPKKPNLSGSKKTKISEVVSTAASEKQTLSKKYLDLRGNGWKKDLMGNWVKDEDAEFDSDEEEPELP